jgi:hypothetical protein
VTSPVPQLRVPEDALARVDAARGRDIRSAWVLRLIDCGLTSTHPASQPAAELTSQPEPASQPSGPVISQAATGPGEPCPGAARAGRRGA